jgi:hypothetical protein
MLVLLIVIVIESLHRRADSKRSSLGIEHDYEQEQEQEQEQEARKGVATRQTNRG